MARQLPKCICRLCVLKQSVCVCHNCGYKFISIVSSFQQFNRCLRKRFFVIWTRFKHSENLTAKASGFYTLADASAGKHRNAQ